jgi:hypothetical protein
MQDIGQHQFLMLLFVIEADLDQRRQPGQLLGAGAAEELHHRRIDMLAIGRHLIGSGAGEVAALRPRVARPGADIIGIEQIGIIRIERPIARAVWAEQELFEKPRGMGAVPFGRAGVRHRLHQLILGAERRGAAFGLVADGKKGVHQYIG